VLVRGRRLDPRRILRYLFQELIAPWIQIKRLWLRVVWFFTTPIFIGPMWTTSVVSGLIGVMLTILLFKPPARLEASTKPVVAVPPPAMLFTPPPLPAEPPPTFFPEIVLDGRLMRTTLDQAWNQLQQTTLVSTSSDLAQRSILQPIRDGWATAQKHLSQSLPAIYRQTAPLWNQAAASSAVTPSDQPLSYGGANESHPALVVSRDIPAESSPSEPITYALTVQNRGPEILEQIVVSEQVSNLDRVESTHPPAEVSADALHWRIDSLRPGQERRLAVTLQPGIDREIVTHGEVRTSVAVSSSTRVVASPLTVNETPPVLRETPSLVEPASREETPRLARLSVVAEIPNSLQVGDELSTVFIVTNSGNGDADSVVLTVAVPGGLEHRDGVLVEHRYAHIPAGATKRAVFKALARIPSTAKIDAVLSMGGTRVADWTTQIQIVARPVATPTSPAGSTAAPIGRGPVPEDGPRTPSFGASVQPSPSTGNSNAPASSTPRDRSIPANAAPPQPGIPVDSSIPRNRRPVAPPTSNPAATPGAVSPPAATSPGSSVPAAPAPNPGTQPDQPEGTNFVSVPRRQGAGAISGWKRVMR
jgi:hypothetical protein